MQLLTVNTCSLRDEEFMQVEEGRVCDALGFH
jgi:hypothetical protein